MRIGFAGRPFIDAILKSFLTLRFLALSNACGFRLWVLVVPQQTAIDEKR